MIRLWRARVAQFIHALSAMVRASGHNRIATGARAARSAVAAVLGLALGVVGLVVVAPTAEAHTPVVTATCSTLTVDLKDYQVDSGHPETVMIVHHDAVGQPTILNPDYKPAVPAVTKTVWKYVRHGSGDKIWIDNDEFKYVLGVGAGSGDGGTGDKPDAEEFYERTQDKDIVIVTPATLAEGTLTIPNLAYKKAWDEEVSNRDFVAPLTNHVTVTVNEVVVKDVDFGASFTGSYSFLANQSNTYTVKVTAWDDPSGDRGWTTTISGTQAGCVTSTTTLPPKVNFVSQTCTVGDKGVPSLTGGNIVLGTAVEGVSIEVKKDGTVVSDLTGLLPGTYTIVASLTDAAHSSWGTLPKDWIPSSNGTVSYSVTIGAADLGPCTVGQPNDVITYRNWTGTPTCANPSVYQTGDVFTAVYSWKDDKWVLGTAVKTGSEKAAEPVVLTADQVKACSINLTLTKSVIPEGPYFGGSLVTYSLVPHNDGPAVAMAGWSVTEVLPEGSILKQLIGDGYDCIKLVCTSNDTLAAGTNGKAITAIVQIPEGMTTGSFKNVAYVSPNPKDTETKTTDNEAQAVVTVLTPQEEGITITIPDAGVVAVAPPEVKGVTVTLPNTGATIPLTWFMGGIGILAAGIILVGASTAGARSRKN